jgi:hypothetical protein
VETGRRAQRRPVIDQHEFHARSSGSSAFVPLSLLPIARFENRGDAPQQCDQELLQSRGGSSEFVNQITLESRHQSIAAQHASRCTNPAAEQQGGAFTIDHIALMITVAESRGDVAEIACVDRCTTPDTVVLPEWHPAIHQDELHVAPPRAKQNTVSAGS